MICAALLAAVAGCGDSGEEQARDVVQDYVDAANADDFDRICELYSDEYIEQLGTEDCPAFVQEQSSGVEQELELVDVRTNGDQATAEIDIAREEEGGPARITLQLVRDGDEWRIANFG